MVCTLPYLLNSPLKTTIHPLTTVKYFSVFPQSMSRAANMRDSCLVLLRALRPNYFLVWGRVYKIKLQQRLNMEVDILIWRFNSLIFNILYLQGLRLFSNFVMKTRGKRSPDERKPRPFILAD